MSKVPVKSTDATPYNWIILHSTWSDDACLIWPFGKSGGYPAVWYRGAMRKGCQIMCALSTGPRPSPKHGACHSCRGAMSGCINPKHLRWATQFENNGEDRLRDGTDNRGIRNGQSRLNARNVLAIRRRYATGGVLMRVLASQYGVNRRHIGDIIKKRRWGWLNG